MNSRRSALGLFRRTAVNSRRSALGLFRRSAVNSRRSAAVDFRPQIYNYNGNPSKTDVKSRGPALAAQQKRCTYRRPGVFRALLPASFQTPQKGPDIPSAFARLIANTAEGGGGLCVRRWRTYRTHTQRPIPIPRVRGSRAKRHCVTVGVGKRHEDESGVLCIDTSTKTQKQSSECTTEQRHERHARVEVALRCRGDRTYEAGTPPHS